MTLTSPSTHEGSNRPSMLRKSRRSFNFDDALSAALKHFLENGYDGSSLSDLTTVMGITRPSLYAAFGNKEALFLRALDLYERENIAYIWEALHAPTAKGVAAAILYGALERQTGGVEPTGCLWATHAVACGRTGDAIRAEVYAHIDAYRAALACRLTLAAAQGDLAKDVDLDGLANMLIAISQDVMIQGGSGASRETLSAMVEVSLRLWPSA